MSLRKSPVRTPAFLAACRANARKSRGPRTPEGKARSRLNSLRHGRYCRKLHRLLPEGLSFHHQFLFRWIHHAIENCFRPATPRDRERARKLAVAVWCQVTARGGKRLMHLGIFLKTGEFEKKALLSPRRVRIRGRNPKQLLTFWTQTEGRRPLLKPGERRWQEPLVRAVWCGGRLAADWLIEPSPDPERDPVWRYYWQRYSKWQYRAFRRARAQEARQTRARQGSVVDLAAVAPLYERRHSATAWETFAVDSRPCSGGVSPPVFVFHDFGDPRYQRSPLQREDRSYHQTTATHGVALRATGELT